MTMTRQSTTHSIHTAPHHWGSRPGRKPISMSLVWDESLSWIIKVWAKQKTRFSANLRLMPYWWLAWHFFLWRWWVWNASDCEPEEPHFVDTAQAWYRFVTMLNLMPYAKGLGPDFFWCCNFQFHSGIPKSEGKTPTDKDHLVRVHLAAPPTWKTFRESWHLADSFWKNVGRLKKKWLKELVLKSSLGVDWYHLYQNNF